MRASSACLRLVALLCATWSLGLGLDMDAARSDAQYAAAAYCGRQNYMTQEWLHETRGFEVHAIVSQESHDIEGYIGYNERTAQIVVGLRGSTSMFNWITNLDIRKMPYPHCKGCEAHEGFYKAVHSVYDVIHGAVSELKAAHPDAEIRVTGHSLGGALGLLAALELDADGFAVVHESFGAPRCGNEAFAAHASQRLELPLRFTHARDLVPHMPLMSQGFHHAALEIWQRGNGTYVTCDESGEDPHCSNSVLSNSIPDHFIYLDMDITVCAGAEYPYASPQAGSAGLSRADVAEPAA